MKSLKIAALGVAAFGLAALPFAGASAADWAGDGIMKHKDELTINVLPVCTLGNVDLAGTDGNPKGLAYQYATAQTIGSDYQGIVETIPTANATDETTHDANVEGEWDITNTTNATGNIEGYRLDTFAATMAAGEQKDELATTTFTIRCNNANGYELKAQGAGTAGHTTALYNTAKNIDIATAAKDSTSWTSDDASYWSFYVSDAADGLTIAEGYDEAAAVPSAETTIVSKDTNGKVKDGEEVTITYGAGINVDQRTGAYTGAVMYRLVQANA